MCKVLLYRKTYFTIEMQAGRISHVTDEVKEVLRCSNIKSRKDPKKRCTNSATHGEFCGIHHKHPRPWSPKTPEQHTRNNAIIDPHILSKIYKWWTTIRGLYLRRKHGPAYWIRNICVNDCDFFSTESLTDISNAMFYSYKDADNHIYGFDIRSIYTLIYRARLSGETAKNPFTRTELPTKISKQISTLAKFLQRHKISTEWAPLVPPTPEQQMRMKIVDIFTKINELNYYSSPDWFIDLDVENQRNFYNNMYEIWTYRANLSMAQKNLIVPGFANKLFRTPRWALADKDLESLQKLNLSVIRTLIESASDRNDRILGAMYVISALTLVCNTARTAYPWLYETVAEDNRDVPVVTRAIEAPRLALANMLGIGWLQDLLAINGAVERHDVPLIPYLRLPPPAANDEEDQS
jgi:hypothetical protein